jgi:phenylpropionate dioxygenase-like ring-hydroxylating dioxygenase large terminal subunit
LRKQEAERVEVRLESVAGLAFVCLSEETEPLQDYLGEEVIQHIQESLGSIELEAFHYHKAVLKTNWKLWNDNNSEIYHIFLHVLNRKTTPEAFWSTPQKLCRNGHALMVTTSNPYARVKYEGYHLESREGGHTFPGLHGNDFSIANIFPDLLLLIRGTVMRIDRMVPLSPGQTLVEWRGVGIKGDTPEVRAMRVRHHNQIWGPMGRNLPEDIAAVEEQWRQMSSGSPVRYSVIAREHEQLGEGVIQALDDGNVRAFYQAWGPHDPFGEAPVTA